jgi:hypothetical protein
MRKTTFSLIIFIAAAIVVLQSCYPGDELTYSDTDIIATFYDKDADFATKMTYAMPDTIYRLDDEGNPIVDPGANDQSILNKIKSELEGYGFTEETPANSDVIVFAVISTSSWVSGGCYYSWYSWYYPYYGWCYPVYYTYDIGTLLIAMIEKDTVEERNGLWVAAMNGLLGDSNSGTLSRVNSGIEQAFSQSPYLGTGK